jgi:sec-independent protein translocase protein TatC
MKDDKAPFVSHLKELRDRLVVSLVGVGIAFIITYYFKDQIFSFLMRPFIEVMPPQSSFIFTSVTEAFLTYFKISIVAALFLASPVILYEIWMFVAPGLYEKEKRYVVPFITFGSICFIAGGLFCYFIIMPYVFHFFVSYGGPNITPMPSLKEYMSLALKMLLIFGLIFQMPLIAYYLSKAGIIKYGMLRKKRRYAILAIVVVSAIITPPEITSQLLMAVPMYGLFELSLIIARIWGKKEKPDGDTAL